MMAPRGVGTMIAMFVVARLIKRVDNRLSILVGFLLTAGRLSAALPSAGSLCRACLM